MAVNLTNADSALKSAYLDVVSEQLNYNVSPFLAVITRSTNDVWGKEVRKLAQHGLSGGIGAGTEDGDLPSASGNRYDQFVATLKNLYGVIEISDKAIRASENNSGAFVNLLNAEMDGLIKSSTFNFGRMLFGDGSGKLSKVQSTDGNIIYVDFAANFIEGMIVEFRTQDGTLVDGGATRQVIGVSVPENYIKVSGSPISFNEGTGVYVQNSYDNEITGLGAIFGTDKDLLYGISKSANAWMKPYVEEVNEINELAIQTALDTIEMNSGSSVNFIMCSMGVRRALQALLSENRRSVDTVELAGGYKAMSYNGIPIVADRFCPKGSMYLLNTNDFTLHQLCDWQWLAGDDGRVLKQIPGKPVYTATLVKYAELICARPNGQGLLTGIAEI